jgi:hypothetical protein
MPRYAVITLLLLAGFGLCACGQETAEPMPELKAHARVETVTGRVTEEQPGRLVVEDAEGARLELERDPASRAEVKEGDEVRASYVLRGKRRVLRDVQPLHE